MVEPEDHLLRIGMIVRGVPVGLQGLGYPNPWSGFR